MSRLLSVEIRRFLARRVTRLLIAAALLGIYLAGVGLGVSSNRDVSAAQRDGQIRYEQALREAAAMRAQCLASVPPGQAEAKCGPADAMLPPEQEFINDPRFSFHDHVRELVIAGVVIGGLVGFVASASFIGAEWQAGTMAGLLMWEPRRQRVLAAKVGVAIVGSVVLAALGIAMLVGVGALVAATRGTFATVAHNPMPDLHFAAETWARVGRGLAFVALFAGTGAGLAMLLRRTVAALGVVLGYLIVFEGVIGSLRHGTVRHYLLATHVGALLTGRVEWIDPGTTTAGGIEFGTGHAHVFHALSSGLILGAVVAVIILAAAVAFQRRDVT
jgi:ABC-2 type transport system permease protein